MPFPFPGAVTANSAYRTLGLDKAAKAVSDYFDPSIDQKDMEEYQAGQPGKDMQAYRMNVDRELATAQVYEPEVKSTLPAKDWIAFAASYEPEVERAAYASIKGEKYDGDETYAQQGRAIHQSLVDTLRSMSPGGEYADNSGISPEELQQYREQYGSAMAGSVYPERLQPNFDALRRAELFSAMLPSSPANQPFNAGLAALGTALYPLDQFMGTASQGRADTNMLRAARYSGPEGRAKEHNYWYERSAPDLSQQNRFFRDPKTGDSRYQTFSTTTKEGLWGALGEDNSRTYPFIANKTLPYSQYPTIQSNERDFISDVRTTRNRPVPITPEGRTPDEMEEAKEFVRDYDYASDDYIPAILGKYGGFYPSGLSKNALNLGRNIAEPMTAVDAAQVIAGGGFSALAAQFLEELAEDSYFGTTMEGTFQDPEAMESLGQTIWKYIGKGRTVNDWMGEDAPPPVMGVDNGFGKAFDERSKYWDNRLKKAAARLDYKPQRPPTELNQYPLPDQSVYYQ